MGRSGRCGIPIGSPLRSSTTSARFRTSRLLLVDDPEGTRIKYTYFVTVRRRWLKPLYAWMVSTLALPFWKRSFVDPLESLVEARRGPAPAS